MSRVRPLILLPSPALALFSELGGGFAVRRVDGWAELRRELAEASAAAVAVVDPYAGGGPGVAPELWELLAALPSATVVAAMELRADRMADVAALLARGAAEVLDLRTEAEPALAARRLAGTLARPLKRMLDDGLSRYVPADARTLLRAAAEVAVLGGGSGELAESFGVLPQTLAAWCRGAGLPPPRTLLAWMRVLLAAAMMGDEGRTLSGVARACGYDTDRSLRRVLSRFLRVDATTLRGGRPFATAVEELNRELRRMRDLARPITPRPRG